MPAFETLHVVETAAAVRGAREPLFPEGLNRLILGDCLPVMQALPAESVDLIYVDPPFFSGRNYAMVFGDADEVRSFSDVWDGGLPAYLSWLGARLREMHRLLKPAGSLCVHLDGHASHYVKVELDGIFGAGDETDGPGFKNEIVWCYSIGGKSKRLFGRKHDSILWYAKGPGHVFNDESPHARVMKKAGSHMKLETGPLGQVWQTKKDARTGKVYRYPLDKVSEDWWTDIQQLNWEDRERLGYPTQKPAALLRRLIGTLSAEGAVVADFFCGGGVTCAVAQELARRWLGCDIARPAIALTADRVARLLAPDLKAPKRKARRSQAAANPDPLAAIARDAERTGPDEGIAQAVAASLYPARGFGVERWGTVQEG